MALNSKVISCSDRCVRHFWIILLPGFNGASFNFGKVRKGQQRATSRRNKRRSHNDSQIEFVRPAACNSRWTRCRLQVSRRIQLCETLASLNLTVRLFSINLTRNFVISGRSCHTERQNLSGHKFSSTGHAAASFSVQESYCSTIDTAESDASASVSEQRMCWFLSHLKGLSTGSLKIFVQFHGVQSKAPHFMSIIVNFNLPVWWELVLHLQQWSSVQPPAAGPYFQRNTFTPPQNPGFPGMPGLYNQSQQPFVPSLRNNQFGPQASPVQQNPPVSMFQPLPSVGQNYVSNAPTPPPPAPPPPSSGASAQPVQKGNFVSKLFNLWQIAPATHIASRQTSKYTIGGSFKCFSLAHQLLWRAP